MRYGAGRRIHPQAAGAHVVVASLQRAGELFLHVLFDGRAQVFRVLRQLHRGVHHDRRARRRLRHVNVVDLGADERVRERRHRKRGIDLEKKKTADGRKSGVEIRIVFLFFFFNQIKIARLKCIRIHTKANTTHTYLDKDKANTELEKETISGFFFVDCISFTIVVFILSSVIVEV